MRMLPFVFVISLLICFITTAVTAESKNAATFDARAAATLLRDAVGWENKKEACNAYVAIWNNITFEQEKQILDEMAQLFYYGNVVLARLRIGRYGFCHTDKDLLYPVPPMLKNDVRLDALILESAMDGTGTDEEKLVEVFATRSPEQLKNIERNYFLYTGSNLRDDLKSELSGLFEYFIFQMLDNADRAENRSVNFQETAKNLYHYGKAGHSATIDIFVRNSKHQLLAIFDEFERLYDQQVEELFQDFKFCTFGWMWPNCDLRNALRDMVAITKNTSSYFAARLEKMFIYPPFRFDDYETDTTRMILSRQYTDLKEIVATYREKYGQHCWQALKSGAQRLSPSKGWFSPFPPKIPDEEDFVNAISYVMIYSLEV